VRCMMSVSEPVTLIVLTSNRKRNELFSWFYLQLNVRQSDLPNEQNGNPINAVMGSLFIRGDTRRNSGLSRMIYFLISDAIREIS
jgi:hypothetical protein